MPVVPPVVADIQVAGIEGWAESVGFVFANLARFTIGRDRQSVRFLPPLSATVGFLTGSLHLFPLSAWPFRPISAATIDGDFGRKC